MRRTLFALTLLMAGQIAHAGPPARPSGAMVLDKVADGLSRYRTECDGWRRAQWLCELASLRDGSRAITDVSSFDPRVIVALGEALYRDSPEQLPGMMLLCGFYPLDPELACCLPNVKKAKEWWEAHEAEMRRRAKHLP